MKLILIAIKSKSPIFCSLCYQFLSFSSKIWMFYWTCGIMVWENVFIGYIGLCYVGMGCFCEAIPGKSPRNRKSSNFCRRCAFVIWYRVPLLSFSPIESQFSLLFFCPALFFYPHKQLIFLGSRCKHNLPHWKNRSFSFSFGSLPDIWNKIIEIDNSIFIVSLLVNFFIDKIVIKRVLIQFSRKYLKIQDIHLSYIDFLHACFMIWDSHLTLNIFDY